MEKFGEIVSCRRDRERLNEYVYTASRDARAGLAIAYLVGVCGRTEGKMKEGPDITLRIDVFKYASQFTNCLTHKTLHTVDSTHYRAFRTHARLLYLT